jgi:hypothetical protein
MRPKQHNSRIQSTTEWVEAAKTLLGLSSWRVTVSDAPASQDAWAEIECQDQDNAATLYLNHELWKQPPDIIRETLTHEMCHIILSRADRVVESLEPTLGALAWAAYEPQYQDATERTAAHLARIIAPLLPQTK